MAIIDSRLAFGEDALITVSADAPNPIDLGAYEAVGARDAIARGDPVWWVNQVTEKAVGNGRLRLQLFAKENPEQATGKLLMHSQYFYPVDLVVGAYWNAVVPVTSLSIGNVLVVNFRVSSPYFTSLRMSSYLTASPPVSGSEGIYFDWRS